MKCKHENNWTITEYSESAHEHTYEDGLVMHNNNPGDMTKIISFICYQCGTHGNFNRRDLPKWLETKLEFILYKPDFTD